MGYLDNSSVTVDAVLTKRGRELLATGNLQITKFALGDDEIDYNLWDPGHDNGSNYYGEAIENLPMLEGFTNDPQTLKYKLITLPKNTQVLPVVTVAESSVVLSLPGASTIISPQTSNISNGNQQLGYTFTVGNADIVSIGANALPANSNITNTTHTPDGNASSHTIAALSIFVTSRAITTTTTTTLTITGNETGGTISIPITVNADTVLSSGQIIQ
tara:strand:- start:2203 stop:2853 length:651 start_codon:yes stop_codon:yes gene_type:complete